MGFGGSHAMTATDVHVGIRTALQPARWLASGAVALLLAASCALIVTTANAQGPVRARTSEGRDVILRADGTWIYVDGHAEPAKERALTPQPPGPSNGAAPATAIGQAATSLPPAPQPKTAPQPATAVRGAAPMSSRPGLPVVQRPRDATAEITTRRGNFRYWYSPQKWRPLPEHVDGRFQLQLKDSEAYIIVIPEGTPVPIPQLKTLALENANKTGSNVRVVSEEMRTIAGREILVMQISVVINKTPVVFLGYYYGDPRGSIQAVAYATERDFPRVKAQLLEGLDGLDLNR